MRRLLLIALLVAGCSGASATVAPSTAPPAAPSAASHSFGTSAPTATLSMAPPTPDITALASTYLQIASPANAELNTCVTNYQISLNDAETQSALAICRDAYASITNGLAAVNWGPVQPEVDDLTGAIAKAQLVLDEWKPSASLEEGASYERALQTAMADVTGAAAVLRSALKSAQASQPG